MRKCISASRKLKSTRVSLTITMFQTIFLLVCHAEVNAILNRNTSDTKGCKMYVALFPCNECAKFIIQSGIEEVIYMSNKNFSKLETIAARRMFEAAGVTYRYEGKKSKSFGVVWSITSPIWSDFSLVQGSEGLTTMILWYLIILNLFIAVR